MGLVFPAKWNNFLFVIREKYRQINSENNKTWEDYCFSEFIALRQFTDGLSSPIHTADVRDSTVESRRRRRCVQNSQLAYDDCRRIWSSIWKLNIAVLPFDYVKFDRYWWLFNNDVPMSSLVSHQPVAEGSANFLGSRAGWAPKELAAGRTGKFYVKNLITVDSPSPSSSCHVISAKALRGNVEIFGILFIIFHDQLHQFSAMYYFSNFTKMSQFY